MRFLSRYLFIKSRISRIQNSINVTTTVMGKYVDIKLFPLRNLAPQSANALAFSCIDLLGILNTTPA